MNASAIRYVSGDATAPQTDGPVVLVHVVNNIGKWGAGFVLAVSRRWPEPERAYRSLGFSQRQLGLVDFVPVASNTDAPWWVANLVGQHGIRSARNPRPVRYDAIETGLATVAQWALDHGATVHMPRIGCGLAGGRWSVIPSPNDSPSSATGSRLGTASERSEEAIEPIIERTLVVAGVDVTVYDVPGR